MADAVLGLLNSDPIFKNVASTWERTNHQNHFRQTALTYLMFVEGEGEAFEETRIEMIRAMLMAGVDPNVRQITRDDGGETALGSAIVSKLPKKVISLLIEAQTEWRGELALALNVEHAEAIELLMQKEDLVRSAYNFPAIAGFGTLAQIKRALALGADARSGVGETPLDMAVTQKRWDVVDLLLESGADINALGAHGPQLFHTQDLETLNALQDRGADLHVWFEGKNLLGKLADVYTVDEHWEELTRELIARGLNPTPWLPKLYSLIAQKKTRWTPKELGGDPNAVIRGVTAAEALPPKMRTGLKDPLKAKGDDTNGHYKRLLAIVSKKSAKFVPERPEWGAAIKLLGNLKHKEQGEELNPLREALDKAIDAHLGETEVANVLREHPNTDLLRTVSLLYIGGPAMVDGSGRNALHRVVECDLAWPEIQESARKRLIPLLYQEDFKLTPHYEGAPEPHSSLNEAYSCLDRAWSRNANLSSLSAWFKHDPDGALERADLDSIHAMRAACFAGWADGVRASHAAGVIAASSYWHDTYTPLELATQNGDLETLSAVLEAGGDPNAISFMGPLLRYASPEAAKFLISQGADTNAHNRLGRTALATLVNELRLENSESKIKRITALLQNGADPNSQDKVGNTPLHEAVLCPPPQARSILKMLLAAGADLRVKNFESQDPVAFAQFKGVKASLVKHLISLQSKTQSGHPLDDAIVRQAAALEAKILVDGKGSWRVQSSRLYQTSYGHVVQFSHDQETYEVSHCDLPKEVKAKTLDQIAWCDNRQYSLCIETGTRSSDPVLYEVDHESLYRTTRGKLSVWLSGLTKNP